ncbi:Mannosyl-oligosaccharide 1,2-alpha-mannosidase MNS1 [Symbiodinium microadriaticum]|uniref:mannosyl-oligosaccharide 1,2-alpha-mannosidase n=1 Tax=Symbiodinium microadriaticum TaxID=2951 RepID=A0A1Q9ERM0_SYMMI|nr:Mannosyl-oligosaccharide 1,2-alpha-mannosidase MNS1 [Symbiodinium microadriaticum]
MSIPRGGSSNNGTTDKWQDLADEVREAFLHAWSGYKRKDTFGNIGMTIIDSLTTLWIMGLKSEFDEGLAFVERDLDFDTADREISVFEELIFESQPELLNS